MTVYPLEYALIAIAATVLARILFKKNIIGTVVFAFVFSVFIGAAYSVIKDNIFIYKPEHVLIVVWMFLEQSIPLFAITAFTGVFPGCLFVRNFQLKKITMPIVMAFVCLASYFVLMAVYYHALFKTQCLQSNVGCFVSDSGSCEMLFHEIVTGEGLGLIYAYSGTVIVFDLLLNKTTKREILQTSDTKMQATPAAPDVTEDENERDV